MGIRSRSYPEAAVVAAVRGYKAGHSQRKIAEVLGIPRTTIREWIHDYHTDRVVLPEGSHSHTWSISTPNGPTSIGICIECFEEREFRNSLEVPDLTPWRGLIPL